MGYRLTNVLRSLSSELEGKAPTAFDYASLKTDGTVIAYATPIEYSLDGGATWQQGAFHLPESTAAWVEYQLRWSDSGLEGKSIGVHFVDASSQSNWEADLASGALPSAMDFVWAAEPEPVPQPLIAPTPVIEPAPSLVLEAVSLVSNRLIEGDWATFEVKLAQATTATGSLQLALVNGSAQRDLDYLGVFDVSYDGGATYTTASSANLTVPSGVSKVMVRIPTLDDHLVEATESFSLSASAGGVTRSAVAQVLDNDAQCGELGCVMPAPDVVFEGGQAVFAVNFSKVPTNAVTVTLGLTNGSALAGQDYVLGYDVSFDGGMTYSHLSGAQVSVPAGATGFLVKVATVDDTVVEPIETFSLSASLAGKTVSGTVSIWDDDGPAAQLDSVIANPSSGVEGAWASFSVNFVQKATGLTNVSLALQAGTASLGQDVLDLIEVSYDGGQTYLLAVNGLITVPPNVGSFLVRVPTLDDQRIENTETFSLVATVDQTSRSAVYNILDNDQLCGELGNVVTAPQGVTEGQDVVFKVNFTTAPTHAATVALRLDDLSAQAGSDYAAGYQVSFDGGKTYNPVVGSSVVVPANALSFYVKVHTLDDSVIESTERFQFSASLAGKTVSTSAAILDNDDQAGVLCDLIADTPTVQEGDSAIFTVKFARPSSSAAVLELQLQGGTATKNLDYAASYEVSFNGGQTYVAVTGTSVNVPGGTSEFKVRVKTIDDTLMESAETFALYASTGGRTVAGVATIVDNDTQYAELGAVSAQTATIVEGGAAVFAIQFAKPGNVPTVLSLSTTGSTAAVGNDFAGHYEVSFDGGKTYVAVSGSTVTVPKDTSGMLVRIATFDDAVIESTESLHLGVTMSGKTLAADVQILDNDASLGALGTVFATNLATEGQAVEFNITMDRVADVAVPLELNLLSQSAQVGVDVKATYDVSFDGGHSYVAVTGHQVMVPAHTTNILVRVATIDDSVVETAESFALSVSYQGKTVMGQGWVLDNDGVAPPPPAPSPQPYCGADVASVSNVIATEGRELDFHVVLNHAASQTGVVTLALQGWCATGDFDYNEALQVSFDGGRHFQAVIGNQLSIPAGTQDFVVRVATVDDAWYENTERVDLTVQSGSSVHSGMGLISDNDLDTAHGQHLVMVTGGSGVIEGQYSQFVVNLNSSISDRSNRLDLSLESGSAKLGEDFVNRIEVSLDNGSTWQQVQNTVQDVPAGVSRVLVRVPTTDDTVGEASESYRLHVGLLKPSDHDGSGANDPFMIDLNRDGHIGVTASAATRDGNNSNGTRRAFDLNGDGESDQVSWVDGQGDGFLVDDRDGHAATSMNGQRLFGDDGGRYSDGMHKLAGLDLNHDGRLSGNELNGLKIWVDNGDAQVQGGELLTMAQAGVQEIAIRRSDQLMGDGSFAMTASVTLTDQTSLHSENVWMGGSFGSKDRVDYAYADGMILDNDGGQAVDPSPDSDSDINKTSFDEDTVIEPMALSSLAAAVDVDASAGNLLASVSDLKLSVAALSQLNVQNSDDIAPKTEYDMLGIRDLSQSDESTFALPHLSSLLATGEGVLLAGGAPNSTGVIPITAGHDAPLADGPTAYTSDSAAMQHWELGADELASLQNLLQPRGGEG